MSFVRLLLLLVAIAASSSGAYAQMGPQSLPQFGMQRFDQPSVSQSPGSARVDGWPQMPAPDFGPSAGPGPFSQPFTTFEIVNEFDVPIYFQLGDGFQYFPQALGPRQSHVFQGPAGQPIYAAIDTDGEYQTFEITPGVTHHIWAYEGWYVITP